MEKWWSVDGSCGCTRRGESSAALWNVAESVIDTRLEELDFDEDELVIEALKLLQEGVDESESLIVRLLLHQQSDKADLKVLAEETTALGGGPFYA